MLHMYFRLLVSNFTRNSYSYILSRFMMFPKGPDDTIGFAQGWSKRKSLYEIEEEEAEEVTEESSTGKTVVTGNETD